MADEATLQMRIRQRQTRSRPIIGSVVALVMLVQSLAALVAAHARFAGVGPGLIAVSVDANCTAGPNGGSETPDRGRGDCSDCCILCGVRDCAAPLLPVARPAAGAPSRQFAVGASMVRRIIDNGEPAGWTSSWSSRAPPSLS